MKKLILILCAVVALGTLQTAMAADKSDRKKPAAKKNTKGKLRHVVVFKYKSVATPDQIAKIEKEFRALKEKIPGIVSIEAGFNNSPEDHAKGFTHIFIVTFRSEKARETYLPHPAHNAFVSVLMPSLDDVFVIDFWAK
jgi:hypothetical protein